MMTTSEHGAERVDDTASLHALLDEAGDLVHRDPVAARALAERCEQAGRTLASASGESPSTELRRLSARSAYLRAQVLAIDGTLDTALRLVEDARGGFLAAGADLDALRTDLGRMHILNEQGRGDEAVRVGQQLLDQLLDTPEGPAAWLRATAYKNLGICFTFAGRYAEAAEADAAAEEAYRSAGLPAEVAVLQQNRAERLLEQGRARDALGLLEVASDGFGSAGEALLEARCRADAGRAQVALGRPADGLASLSRAASLLDRLGMRADVDQLRLRTAQAYLAVNLYDEAIALLTEVEESFRRSGLVHYQAMALAGLGAAMAAVDRLDDARRTLHAAASGHDANGGVALAAAVRVELATVLHRLGESAAALELLQRVRSDVAGRDWPVQLVYTLLRLADFADTEEAETALVEAGRLAEMLALPALTFRVDARLGALRRRQGRPAQARVLLTGAIDAAEEQRSLLPSQAMRTSFLRDKVDAYAEVVALELDRGAAGARAAFAAAERSTARALVDQLGETEPTRADATEDESPAALSGDLAAVYDELLAGETAAADTDPRRGMLRRRAEELERGLLAARAAADGSSADPTRTPLGYDELRERLDPDVVLVAYHLVGDDVVAFIGVGERLEALRLTTMARLRPLLDRLEVQWRRFDVGPQFVRRHASRLLAGTEEALAALAAELLDPLGLPEPEEGKVGRLAIVPCGPLHGLPFHALPLSGRPLLAGYEVSVAPSASVLGLLPALPAVAERPALVLGVQDPTIAAAADEARAVAAGFTHGRLHLGPAATGAALRSGVPGAGVLHLACHGMFRPDAALFSALRLGDGWFTAADAATLRLDSPLVVLSACETGRQQISGGEALGLPRAFLAAGAAAVVVSLWLVHDDTAARLMHRVYGEVRAGARPAAALRTAQLEIRDNHPHPYHWAPFTVTGAC